MKKLGIRDWGFCVFKNLIKVSIFIIYHKVVAIINKINNFGETINFY